MESLLGSRSLGEESLQMWDLNKRLEAYLARVKYLEEENELLKAEIQSLRVSPQESSWRGKYEEELAALRATLDQAFREKHTAELARDSLHEEVQQAKGRCQRERSAQEEAKKLLSESKKELEEEKRAQLWLREKAVQLEKEVEALAQAHQQEMAALDQERNGLSWSLDSFRGPLPAVCFQPVEVEDYAKRLSGIWKGAVETYKTEVSQLEASLCEAKEDLWRATEGNRQNQLQLQQLQKELASLKRQKEMLEESLAQQWQHQHGEAEKLQLALEALEEEKQSLRVQIAQVLEDRQHLMHLKMSLSLEVATYRTLLEAESTRLQLPAADFKISGGLRGTKREASHSKLHAVSLDKGHLGSWDLKLGPIHLMKASGKPRLLANHPAESPAVSLGALPPKSCRSAGVREFQKANDVLQSQPSKHIDVGLNQKDAPEAPAFKLGSPQQSKQIVATKTEMVSPSFFHEIPQGQNSISLRVAEASLGSSMEKGCQEEDEGRNERTANPVEAEETGEEAESCEEKEVEVEKRPNEEPPGKASVQNLLYPTPLITEALETAIKEVNGEGICLDRVSEAQPGAPFSHSLPMEEESRDARSPSREVLEEAAQEVHEGQKRDIQWVAQPGDVEGSQHATEAHGGQETCPEQQEGEGGEGGLWVSWDAESSSPLRAELPEEEQRREHIATGVVPAADETELDKDARPLSQTRGAGTEEPPTLASVEQKEDSEEPYKGTRSLSDLEEAPAEKESWQPSPSPTDHHRGAVGGHPEEVEGGVEDLEVVSTEALHLSEDEERRALWSPSQENEEEYDLQAEMLGAEFLQEGGFADDRLSPLSHTALSVTGGQELLCLQVEQEKLREQDALLCAEIASASPDALGPEAFSAEEAPPRDRSSAARREENALAGEAQATGRGAAAEEEKEETVREESPRDGEGEAEENNLGDSDARERESVSEVETVGQPALHKEEDNWGNEDTEEPERFPDMDNMGHKDLREENNLGTEDTVEQEGFSSVEIVEYKAVHEEENNLGNEDIMEQEGFSGVENTGQEDTQEIEGENENEAITDKESFSDMENVGCKDIYKEENHLGNEDTVEQNGFPDVENIGYQGLQAEENNLEKEDAIDGESLSDGERSRHKTLHKEEDSTRNDDTGEQGGLSVVENIRDLQREEEVLDDEETMGKTGFSAVEMTGHQGLQEEEDPLANEGTDKQEVFSDLEMIHLHVATCQPDVTLQKEENILGQDNSEQEQTEEEKASHSKDRLPTEQKPEEEDVTVASPVAEGAVRIEDLNIGIEPAETEEEEAGGRLEMEEMAGHLTTSTLGLEENSPWCSEAQGSCRTETLAATEQQSVTGGKEEVQSQPTTHVEQTPVPDSSQEASAPLQTRSDVTNRLEAKDHQSQSDYSGSEDSLESLDTSPNATCERDILEKEGKSSTELMLEETLPDHTPLHMYDEQMLAVRQLSESKEFAELPPVSKDSSVQSEDTQHALEEERRSSLLLQENDQEQERAEEQSSHRTETAPNQHAPNSQELPAASKDLEDTATEMSGLFQDSKDIHTREASRRGEEFAQDSKLSVEESDNQPEAEASQPGSHVEEEYKHTAEEERSPNCAGEAEKDSIVPEDLLDPSNPQEGAHEEEGGTLDLSDESIAEDEEACKVSPLTSVTDLGEIVLEGDVSPGEQRSTAESKVSTDCLDEFQQISQQDHTQEYLFETGPSSKDFPDASTEATVSISSESMKDSDILEIVEQALEFNQELIKAAEERAEAELSAVGREATHLPEEKGHYASLASLERGESQISVDVPKAASLSAKDPTETNHLWVASDTNGLQQDAIFSDFTKALELNGIGHLPPSLEEYGGTSTEEVAGKTTAPQEFQREEMGQSGIQGPGQTPPKDETKRTGEDIFLLPEKDRPDDKGPEALDPKDSLSADIMQTACLKGGKDAEMEALPILPHFQEEVLRLESGQHLKFREEADEQLWSPEDN